jgi:hypothetical protein
MYGDEPEPEPGLFSIQYLLSDGINKQYTERFGGSDCGKMKSFEVPDGE